ncbi:MAG: hypothetical protein GY866_20110 [Proteobacteria bacterium]|nr:hypothetical protein [Pseudomonadota bacterium]
MKIFSLILALCFMSSSNLLAQGDCYGPSCMPQKVQNDCTVMQSNGCIDWANGVIYATGMGVPNPKFPTQAQRNYSAIEAAKTVAMRNLLQMVEGINLTSSKTVKDGMLESDVIQTQISGKLRHVLAAGKPKKMNDGSVWMTMKMHLRDIISILVNNEQFALQSSPRPAQTKASRKQAPAPEKPKSPDDIQYGGKPDVIYSGVIIDARGTGISPAMSPKIYDGTGKEIYGSTAVERDFVLRYGVAGYVKDIKSALKNKRVKGNPLIIKANINSGKSTDLTISNKDAKLLNQLDASQTFLREARVVIVIG